jgi:phage-related protein
MKKKLEFDWLRRQDNTSEFEEFVASLPIKDASKLLAVIQNTEMLGIGVAIRMQWVKNLDDDLYELRSKQGSDIQRVIYSHETEMKYMITHGFTKKTQKTPESEIEHAREMRRRHKEEKRK